MKYHLHAGRSALREMDRGGMNDEPRFDPVDDELRRRFARQARRGRSRRRARRHAAAAAARRHPAAGVVGPASPASRRRWSVLVLVLAPAAAADGSVRTPPATMARGDRCRTVCRPVPGGRVGHRRRRAGHRGNVDTAGADTTAERPDADARRREATPPGADRGARGPADAGVQLGGWIDHRPLRRRPGLAGVEQLRQPGSPPRSTTTGRRGSRCGSTTGRSSGASGSTS